MKNIGLAILFCVTACVDPGDASTATTLEESANAYCMDGGGIIRCDGLGEQGDAACSLRCHAAGYQGGFCFHPNGGVDLYHGLCASGFEPVAPDPESEAISWPSTP